MENPPHLHNNCVKTYHSYYSGTQGTQAWMTLMPLNMRASYMPRHYALTPANVHDASLLTIWSRTVHFPHYKQMDERRPEMEKIPAGSAQNCTRLPAKKDATSFKEMQTRPCLQVLSAEPLGGQLSTIYRTFVLCFQLTFGVMFYVPTQTVTLETNYYKTLILAFLLVLIIILPLDFLKSPFRNR